MTAITSDNPLFWQNRYLEHQTPWDLGEAAPPFIRLLETQKTHLPPAKMAVLGSGYGHDAALFGQAGFDVVGFDYAPYAIEAANERYGQFAQFEAVDIFNLPPAWHHYFDYVLEHTCFCAIPVEQRQAYVQAVQTLLKPHGKLIGLFWAHQEDGGPPFKTSKAEIETLFLPHFKILSIEQAQDSTPSRAGEELLVVMQAL